MIIALAGNTGAGKSTLTRLLKKPLDANVVTVGYILRAQARRANIRFEDYLKQIEGQHGKSAHIIALADIIRSILRKHQTVIVEGTYKVEDVAVLKRLFPKEPLFVFTVESARNIRIRRIMKRKKLTETGANEWVTDQDSIRKDRYRMEEVGQIADGRIVNIGLSHRQLFEEFSRQFKASAIKRITAATILKKKREIRRSRRLL